MKLSLLDTDILSEVFKRKNAKVLERASEYLLQHQQLAISAVSRYEVVRGLRDKKATRRLQAFDLFCRNAELFPISEDVLDRASDLWLEARRGGHPRVDADLFIAATALVHSRVLVTGNTAHFAWISGIELDNWRSE